MTPITCNVSDAWKKAYPGAVVGVLAMRGVLNPPKNDRIEERRKVTETKLRTMYGGMTREKLRDIDVLKAYDAYYGAYGKTYHVLLQLESVAHKGKSLSSSGALVEVMFIAEVGNLLLTAGHDLDAITGPLTLDIAKGTESYTAYRGNIQIPKQNDMMMSDAHGILSCVLHGPDNRTRIKDSTKNVLFVVYAPKGIELDAVRQHVEELQSGTLAIAPEATTELFEMYEA